jgi:hypothetical protein
MIFQIEIPDDALAFVDRVMVDRNRNFAYLDRHNSADCEKYRQLLQLHLVYEHSYYGDQICYHPSYSLTEMGMKALAQYRESR